MNINELILYLLSVCQLIDSEENEELILDIHAFVSKLINPNCVVSAFAPFKHGKSTLLNAILGAKILPMGIVPTTGTAIQVKYGNELATRITLTDEAEILADGVEILSDYAVLSKKNIVRDNIQSVELFYSSSFLKNEVELWDLPGSKDQLEQTNALKQGLLMSDIVIQVLNAQQLFSRSEQEELQEWVIDKGIETIIFVVNYMNLLETDDDRQEVWERAVSIAKGFRVGIPDGISNVYRVDAKLALLSRLKLDNSAYFKSGLHTFDGALQNLISIKQQSLVKSRLPRLKIIARKLGKLLEEKIEVMENIIGQLEQDYVDECEKRKQLAKNLRKRFNDDIKSCNEWMSSFGNYYWKSAAASLAENQFTQWENNVIEKHKNDFIKSITYWVDIACQQFEHSKPSSLTISLPLDPTVYLPKAPDNLGFWDSLADMASGGDVSNTIIHNYRVNVINAYLDASTRYLNAFQSNIKSSVESYIARVNANEIFEPTYPPIPEKIILGRLALEKIKQNINILRNLEFYPSCYLVDK